MILPLLSVLLAVSGATAQWTKVNQPAKTLIQNATILSDGRWVGVDTSYASWISTNRGSGWSTFVDADGTSYADILGNGIPVTWDSTGGIQRYDAATSKWIASTFDRALTTGGDATSTWPAFGLAEEASGRYYYWLDRTDSALFFVSTDSARTWKTAAVLAEFFCPGGFASYAGALGGWVWVEDTVGRRLRGTINGSSWVDIPFSSGVAYEAVLDSLAGGGWIVEKIDSNGVVDWQSTTDSGKTWQTFDASQAGSIPSSTAAIGAGWLSTTAFSADTELTYVQPPSGAWILLPEVPAEYWEDFFVDNGLIYGTGDSGLVSLNLGVLGVRGRKVGASSAVAWRMEGSDLVVSNAASASGWELRDISGRDLATGKSTGASELRIPTGDSKGLLLVRLNGAVPQTFSVLAP